MPRSHHPAESSSIFLKNPPKEGKRRNLLFLLPNGFSGHLLSQSVIHTNSGMKQQALQWALYTSQPQKIIRDDVNLGIGALTVAVSAEV